MNLQESSEKTLRQLIMLLEQMDEEQYGSPNNTLSESSIGGHVRHIIEFYKCLINGNKEGLINYDNRPRNILLESDRYFALQSLINIICQTNQIKDDKSLKISMDFSENGNIITIDTTFYRELAYNIEHAIHHMAIIKIGVHAAYPDLSVEANFGVAYSTIKHKALECAQ